MAALQQGLCLFGSAAGDNGQGFRYKILAAKAEAKNYRIFLWVTNVLESYMSSFSLQSLLSAAEEESNVMPEPEQMLGWVVQQFRNSAGAVEAQLDAAGAMQLVAVQRLGDVKVTIRLPPQQPMQPLPGAERRAWVAQDVLFSTGEQLHETARELDDCERRCPHSQQLEDAAAFLGSGGQEQADGGTPRASHAAPRVSLFKRKLSDPEPAAVGSAVKAARPGDGTGHQPASSQLTGGMSGQSRGAEASFAQPKRVEGRGRGRGRGKPVNSLQLGKR